MRADISRNWNTRTIVYRSFKQYYEKNTVPWCTEGFTDSYEYNQIMLTNSMQAPDSLRSSLHGSGPASLVGHLVTTLCSDYSREGMKSVHEVWVLPLVFIH